MSCGRTPFPSVSAIGSRREGFAGGEPIRFGAARGEARRASAAASGVGTGKKLSVGQLILILVAGCGLCKQGVRKNSRRTRFARRKAA